MKEKTKKALACILAVILLAGVCASTAIGISAMNSVNHLSEDVTELLSEMAIAQEDDVTIASRYVIRSTTAISDAYKSGDTSELDDKQKETLDMASAVLDEIISDGMSDYEKELAVHEWMTSEVQKESGQLTVIPSTTADSDNPYGVLKYHNALCVGYATTFRLFMQMMDIPCMVVHNPDRYHSWNLVQLDGEWYHTDIYFDVENGNYTNFNMSDTMCSRSHDWNTEFFPAANGIKYNYGYQNRTMVNDIYEIPAMFKAALDEKKGELYLGFTPEFTEEEAQLVETMLDSVQARMNSSEEYWDLWATWTWSPVGEEGYLLQISINGFEDDDTSTDDISEEDLIKIEEAVENAFGNDGAYGEDGANADGI